MQEEIAEPELEGSPSKWFMRGFAAGVLVMASVNAISYFVRSSQWNTLIGIRPDPTESIGFPWKMWEGGNSYAGLFVDYPRLGLNVIAAIVVGAVIGMAVAMHAAKLNRLLACASAFSEKSNQRQLQFSLKGLMIATCLVAVGAMLATQYAARRETLIAIYAIGPTALVVLAMLPRRLHWQTRVWMIIPATLCLIAAAIAVGTNLKIEFDRVLMAIFLCWTPQSALGALMLTAWWVWALSKRSVRTAGQRTEAAR